MKKSDYIDLVRRTVEDWPDTGKLQDTRLDTIVFYGQKLEIVTFDSMQRATQSRRAMRDFYWFLQARSGGHLTPYDGVFGLGQPIPYYANHTQKEKAKEC